VNIQFYIYIESSVPVRYPAEDADVAAAAITTTSRRHEMQLAARRIRWMCLLCACALADQRVNTANNDTAQTGSTSVRHVPSRPVCLARPGEHRPSDLSAGSRVRTTTPIAAAAAFDRLDPLLPLPPPSLLLSSQVRGSMTHTVRVYIIIVYVSSDRSTLSSGNPTDLPVRVYATHMGWSIWLLQDTHYSFLDDMLRLWK